MKTVNVTRNTGNFTYVATLEISDEVLDAIIEQGIVRVFQGGTLGAWEKSLAYPGKGVKRPEGFKRTDIEFTDANAEALKRALMGAEIEVGRNEKDEPILADLGVTEVTVTEYTGPEKAEPKFAQQKELVRLYLFEADGKTARMLASGEPRTAASFATNRGIAVPTEPWEEDSDFLAAIKAWQKAQAASQD